MSTEIETESNTPICPIKDNAVKSSYLKDGFVVFQTIVEPYTNDLEAICSSYIKQKDQTFQYSLMENSFEKNQLLHQHLIALLQPLLDTIFDHYSTYSGSLLIKPGVSGTEMHLHQDWTFTDEKNFSPCTVWIPLQDMTAQNGSLFFLPGSHRFLSNFRSHHYETARIDKEKLGKYVKTINVKKGDLIVFNPACFHGSFSNQENKPRVAISITVLDKKAPFVHVKKVTETSAKIFQIDANCFFKDLALLNETYAFESENYEHVYYEHTIPTEEELLLKIKAYVS